MLNRREFLTASAVASVAATLPKTSFAFTPLRASPTHRRIFAEREASGAWLLHSDGPYSPRHIVRPDVIEEVFGAGTYNQLSQRDHWAMIDAGWFSGDDLHLPIPLGDDTYMVWRGYYHPVTEAHDLLADLFTPKYGPPHWFGTSYPNGIDLAEHPSTPRYATARVWGDLNLLRCIIDVKDTGPWLSVEMPDELKTLMARYSDEAGMDELTWPMRNRTRMPSYENGYMRAHRKQQERAALAKKAADGQIT